MDAKERIIVALDTKEEATALEWIETLHEHVGAFKIGLELFLSTGPRFVRQITSQGARVFLDLKFHDIPNTVKGAVSAATQLGVWMLNVHASGGGAMIQAAADAIKASNLEDPPILLGVTMLTSIDSDTMKAIGVEASIEEQVIRLARLAQQNGAKGVVASAHEARAIKQACGRKFVVVTPGVRPAFAQKQDDQKRKATPAKAIQNGADYLVIGRPITQANDMIDAARRIAEEIEEAVSSQ